MIFTEFDFQLRKVSINSDRIPQSFKGLKIVHISDFHLGSWYGKKPLQKAVDMINELKPDIIFFTGDMVNYATNETVGYTDILKQLKAKKGVYAILGNHDYGDYVKWNSAEEKQKNMQDFEDFYKQISWILLKNENIRIQSDSSFISIVGVENWGKDVRFPKKGDISKALQGVDNNDYTILLSHDPSHFENLIGLKYPQVDLCLSGHTHGMQMGISTDNFEWSPAQLQYKYWGGLYENTINGKKQYLYVNRGIGVIGYPGRIGIKPEITLIELN
jgi:predicted MPP superfamily phosphohydrolase